MVEFATGIENKTCALISYVFIQMNLHFSQPRRRLSCPGSSRMFTLKIALFVGKIESIFCPVMYFFGGDVIFRITFKFLNI